MMDYRYWIWSSGLEQWEEIVEPERFTLKYVTRKYYKGQPYSVYTDATLRYVATSDLDLNDPKDK